MLRLVCAFDVAFLACYWQVAAINVLHETSAVAMEVDIIGSKTKK